MCTFTEYRQPTTAYRYHTLKRVWLEADTYPIIKLFDRHMLNKRRHKTGVVYQFHRILDSDKFHNLMKYIPFACGFTPR